MVQSAIHRYLNPLLSSEASYTRADALSVLSPVKLQFSFSSLHALTCTRPITYCCKKPKYSSHPTNGLWLTSRMHPFDHRVSINQFILRKTWKIRNQNRKPRVQIHDIAKIHLVYTTKIVIYRYPLTPEMNGALCNTHGCISFNCWPLF